jgi:hypothetical protein
MSAKGTSSFHQHVIDTGGVCCICLDPLDTWTGFVRLTCCGKRIHEHCYNELQGSISHNKCPMCRETMAKTLEEIHACSLRWAARGKAWAMYQVGENFYLGRGVAQEQRMAQLWFRKRWSGLKRRHCTGIPKRRFFSTACHDPCISCFHHN